MGYTLYDIIGDLKGKIMATVDLHTHSTASDGDLYPDELLSLASENGIKILSLTDHDTVDGLDLAQKKAKELGIVFIPGMEISAKSEEELHIIGYYIEKENEEFQRGLDKLVEYRNQREKITIDYLNNKGVDINAQEVKEATKGNIIGRPHMAAVMIQKGYVKTKKEAFDKYIGTPEYMALKRPKTTVQESLDIIKSGHGVPVLAHPHSLKQNYSQLNKTLGELKSMGLKGVECYYNSYDITDTVNYMTLALKHGLVPTGGSDFHGPLSKPDVKIGTGKHHTLNYDNLKIPEILQNLKE